jgi:tetratricopeptide (TPR) repeat protein
VTREVARSWSQAIDLFQTLLNTEPASADIWLRLAAVADRADRRELAIDAYEHVIALLPDDARGHLGLASAMVRNRQLEDASQHAAMALSLAGDEDARSGGAAHELLARIALARRESATARSEAALADDVEPGRSLVDYVEGRLLQDQRRYDEALERFEHAVAELGRSHGRSVAELHASAAQTLVRLDRYAEAEYHFLEELRSFPMNTRARADLATLYHTVGRGDEAAQALEDLVRITPTPDAYLLAARTWTTFGELARAEGLRARVRDF